MKTSLGSPMALLTILLADAAFPDGHASRQGDRLKYTPQGRPVIVTRQLLF